MPECQAILAHTGEKCHREEGHTQYHRGDGGPFGPWVGPDRITPKKRRASIESLVAQTQRERTSRIPGTPTTGKKES